MKNGLTFSRMSTYRAGSTWVTAGALLSLSASVLWYLRSRAKLRTIKQLQMKLYTYPEFRSNRCIWLANELGISENIEFIKFNPQDPDKQKVEEYRRYKHPHGTIPTLVVEGEPSIIESGAICLYLADLHGRLVPPTHNRGDYYNWIVYACSTLDEAMEHLLVQWMFTEPVNQDQELIKKMTDKFAVFAGHFSKHIESKKYICGDMFTAADCVLGYNLWWALQMKEGSLLKDYPQVLAYFKRLQSRSSFQKTFQ